MLQDGQCRLRLIRCAGVGGQLLRGAWRAGGDHIQQPALQGDDLVGRLLARLHPRLVIGVDTHQRGVEPHRTLEQGDDRAKVPGIAAAQGEGYRLAAALVQGATRAHEEAGEVIAGGHSRLHLG